MTDVAPSVPAAAHRVVSRDQWLKERVALLAEEKELTRKRDEVSRRVRDLPWVKVEKRYTFHSAGGAMSLADLFGPRSQLVVYHFMFDPTWSQGCKSCSFVADHYNGIVVHLAHRDISFVTVSKAPIAQLEEFRERMGWSFPWASGADTDFSRDFGVSFTDQELASGEAVYNFDRKPYPIRELPGVSVFVRDARGDIYHTYSTFARGLEDFLTAYRYIDITPKGRDEAQTGGMGWLRHHDRYGDADFVDPWAERPGVTGPSAR
ncbi:MAG TPA: thioredoxin family protein [Phycisphaerales bacterium]|nr:thioredoxin family protein [Phycisphaerales bacterium]